MAKNQIAVIKYYAVKLRANYQIPMMLYLLIEKLDKHSSLNLVAYLKATTEKYLRVNGYWKKNRKEEEEVNKLISQEYMNVK